MRNLSQELEQGLPPVTVAFLKQAGEIAAREGLPLYLVGGSVRDLILGKAVLDLDLVVEGDAPLLASLLSKELGGEVTARSQFSTAKLKARDLVVDLATARQETYDHPGALPKVRPGSLHQDLARRDFTINATALELRPSSFGSLIDPFQGERDLSRGLIRVLHEGSFIDDATRILRALRYEARMGFHLEKMTEELAHRHVSYLTTISSDRVRRELERTFQEPEPERALARAQEVGALSTLLPPLAWPTSLHQQVQAFRGLGERPEALLFLALLCTPLADTEQEPLIRRLNAPSRWSRVVRDTFTLRNRLPSLASSDLLPSQVLALLRDLELDAVQAWGVAAPEPQQQTHLKAFYQRLRYVKPKLTGHDLLALGTPQGAIIGQLLEELLCARLDGLISSRSEEEALIRRRLKRLPTSHEPTSPGTTSGGRFEQR